MIGYLNFFFIFAFTTLPLYGHPPTIDIFFDDAGETPAVVVQATGENVILESADTIAEKTTFEKTLANQPPRALPHCSDLDTWLEVRDNRRRNLSL